MNQATIENLLKWNTDLASVNQALAANLKVVQSTERAATANAGVVASSTAAAGATGLLSRAWDANSIAARGFLQELTQIQAAEAGLTAETVALTAAQKAQAAFVTRQGAGGGLGRGITKAGRALFNLPDIGGVSTPVSRLLIAGGGGIEAANLSLAALGATAAVAVPLVLGLVAAAGELGKTSEESARRAKTFADAYSQALEAGTTAQVQELIKRQQNEIAIAEATTKVLQQKAAEAPEQLANFLERSSQDLAQRLNEAAGGAAYNPDLLDTAQSQEAYNAQVEEQQKIIDQGKIALEAYNMVFGESIIATGNAADAEQELADLRKQLADARTEREVNQVNAELAAQRLTSEERQKRIAELGEEIAILRARSNAEDLSANTQLVLIGQLTDLEAEYGALISVTDSYADRLARQAAYTQALSDQTDNYFDALEREVAVREDIAAGISDINSTLAEEAQKLGALADDRRDKIIEAEQAASDKRIELAEDTADRIAKIERDFGRERLNDIRDRDVDALIRARVRAADDLADESKNADKQQERLDKQLAKQEASINTSLDKQVRQVQQAYDNELTIKRQRLQQSQTDLVNLLNAEQQIQQSGSNNQRTIHINMWNDLDRIANNGALQLARSFANGLVGAITSGVGLISDFGTPGNPLPPVTGTAAIRQIAQQEARNVFYGAYEATAY